MITGFCKKSAGYPLVERGDYRILRADDTVIYPPDIAAALRPGMKVEMSIVLREQTSDRRASDTHRCPRCKHVDRKFVTKSGWSNCIIENMLLTPVLSREGLFSAPQDIHYFRRINLFRDLTDVDSERDYSQWSSMAGTPLIPMFQPGWQLKSTGARGKRRGSKGSTTALGQSPNQAAHFMQQQQARPPSQHSSPDWQRSSDNANMFAPIPSSPGAKLSRPPRALASSSSFKPPREGGGHGRTQFSFVEKA
ncbi:hypothetical protein HWV62_6965 [Athelia sp. TMB]|nr:hypothetical protein HWV62_6965 [Athelia sp. TMB]